MIVSFRCKETERIWNGRASSAFPSDIQNTARRKLRILDAAADILDLRQPPGNHLELLQGDRAGQHSIRVNNKWRLCFEWREGNAHQVEMVDYH